MISDEATFKQAIRSYFKSEWDSRCASEIGHTVDVAGDNDDDDATAAPQVEFLFVMPTGSRQRLNCSADFAQERTLGVLQLDMWVKSGSGTALVDALGKIWKGIWTDALRFFEGVAFESVSPVQRASGKPGRARYVTDVPFRWDT